MYNAVLLILLSLLVDIIPKKIKAREFFEIMKQWEAENGNDSDS